MKNLASNCRGDFSSVPVRFNFRNGIAKIESINVSRDVEDVNDRRQANR